MWDWLWPWGRKAEAPSLPGEDVKQTAPRVEGIRAGAPKAPPYSFASADAAAPRRNAPGYARREEAGRAPVLGIDLGTAHASAAAVVGNSRIVLIPNQEGELTTPCAVARAGDRWLVGEPAVRHGLMHPAEVLHSFRLGFGVPGAGGPPQFLAALVLRKLRQAAEAHLGQRPTRVVLTVPATFGEAARQAAVEAAYIAGFDSDWTITCPETARSSRQRMRLLPEPASALLALSLTAPWERQAVVALHLGAGHFGVTALDVGDGVLCTLAVDGGPALLDGGAAGPIRSYLEGMVGVRLDEACRARVRAAAEEALVALSGATRHEVALPYMHDSLPGGLLHAALERRQLENWLAPGLARCAEMVRRVLAEARLEVRDISQVVLTGGLARVPCVRRMVDGLFAGVPCRQLNNGGHTAAGAAILGHQLHLGARSRLLLVDVVPLALSVSDGGPAREAVPRGATVPLERTTTFEAKRAGRMAVTVFQGATRLGEVALDGVAEGAKAEAKLAVDAAGQIDVHLREVQTGRTASARLFPDSGLPAGEADRLRMRLLQESALSGWRG